MHDGRDMLRARVQPEAANPIFSPAVPVGSGAPGLVLLSVLLMVVLLVLLAGGFTFLMRAHANAVFARQAEQQARMAADAGIQRAIVEIRKPRTNPDELYDNAAIFRQAPIHQTAGRDVFQTYGRVGRQGGGTGAERSERPEKGEQPDPVWRFTLYAVDDSDPQNPVVRYGPVAETSKLDLNLASEAELRRLIFSAVEPQSPDGRVFDRESLADCLLDWRDRDGLARPKGAEDEYYLAQRPGYRAKNGRFDTVEELFTVRGFTGWVLYGEDYNRNGLLDPNEDDGDASFPPDNRDGKLYRGVGPDLTVHSREVNIDSQRRPRVNLNMKDVEKLDEELRLRGVDGRVTDYVLRIRAAGLAFRSVMDLVPVPPPEPDEEEEQQEQEDQTTQPADPTTQPTTGPATRPSEDSDDPSAKGPTTRPGAGRKPPLTNLTDEIPPATIADLPVLLDVLTTDPLPIFAGRINVNTAGRAVLSALEGLSEEDVEAIVSGRARLSGDDKATPAWLLTQGVISERRFRELLPRLTTQSSTFSVDSLGFADHVGTVKRMATVFEMRGPIGQVLYTRDLTPLGPAYSPHGEETRGLGRRSGS